MTSRDRERYSRQLLFAGIGEDGQKKLLEAQVAIVGCGALGSFQAASLARAGVGTLRIIDRDYVEFSNLQRQWLFDEADADNATPKAIAAARQIAKINSTVAVIPFVVDLTPANAEDLLADVDLILDGTDNFETRYLLNDYAIENGIPWIYGAAVASYGLTMPVLPGRTACLQCVYPNPPAGAQETCETAGVVNSITAVIAALQTSDALKLLCGHSQQVIATITTVDLWSGVIRKIDPPQPDPDCPCCIQREFAYLRGEKKAPISLCGRNAVQIHERTNRLRLKDLARRLERAGTVRVNDFALTLTLDNYVMTIFPDGRAIIKGTTDIAIARGLYSKYVGN